MLLIGVCLLSAALFATGNSLQHVGANNLGGTNLPPLQIALRLARNKTWLLGSAIALTAFGTHVLALGLGEVGVVQPLLLVGVIFGICFRPLLDGARAHVIEISGAVIAVAGLILYIRAGAIYDSEPVAPRGDASSFSVVVVALVCLLLSLLVGVFSATEAMALAGGEQVDWTQQNPPSFLGGTAAPAPSCVTHWSPLRRSRRGPWQGPARRPGARSLHHLADDRHRVQALRRARRRRRPL